MKVASVKDIEDCFDGTFIKELLLTHPITEPFIKYLGKRGDLNYYPDFARPFFKLTEENMYTLKGIEGSKVIRVIFAAKNMQQVQEKLINTINSWPG